MDIKKLFEKYRARLVREGILKALIWGIMIGFAANFVFALVTSFFTDWWEYWYLAAIGLGLVVGLIAGIILYFAAFRPDTKAVARRVDSLGLEERLITMTELENDDSYIAKRQREDAKAKLSLFDAKSIKFAVAKSLIIAAIIVSVFGASMTTVNALVQFEVIPPIEEIVVPPDPDAGKVLVLYEVSDELGGWIEGETEQLIDIGGKTTPVVAVAAEGWMFVSWEEDQIANPERFEENVLDDDEDGYVIFTAIFEEIGESEEQGDLPTDEPSDTPNEEETDTFDEDGTPNDGQDGRFEPSNQIEDGSTPYQDKFPDYYKEALDKIQSGYYDDENNDVVDSYFDILKGGANYTENP